MTILPLGRVFPGTDEDAMPSPSRPPLCASMAILFNFTIMSVDKYHGAVDIGRYRTPSITLETACPFQGFKTTGDTHEPSLEAYQKRARKAQSEAAVR